MSTFATPYPPTREAMVDTNGYVTDRWSAFFDSFFQTQVGIPTGAIMEYGGSAAPTGWLLCDGASYPISGYPGLFAVLGDTFGGDAVNFNVPDRRGKFAEGAINAGEIGNMGGNADFTIDTDHLPNIALSVTDPGHNHAFTPIAHSHAITDAGHTHTTATGGGAGGLGAGALSGAGVTGNSVTGIVIQDASADGDVEDSATGITVQLVGGGQSFSLVPPYIKMNFIIKY